MRTLSVNEKAVSTLILIILLIISAVLGGLISYLFTIAYFTEIPKGTTATITGIYLDKENATAFKIEVLNPSYSPANATITKIAVNLKQETRLYDVLETEPSIVNGIAIPKGKTLNITCSKLRIDEFNMTWGEFAAKYAGEPFVAHVFSSDTPAANMEATLPLVKLHITDTDFDSTYSFRKFNITVSNDADSVINLTMNEIMVAGVELEGTSPELPQSIENGTSAQFAINGSWHGLRSTSLAFSTKEGYKFSKDLNLSEVYTTIQDVIVNENYTDHFNVTVFNLAESANYVNVTKIVCTLENGTTIERNYDPQIPIEPNSTHPFMIDESWREYRGKKISITAYLLQDFETQPFEKTTPQSIILKILNEKEAFQLIDDEHCNITLQNHQSSLKVINITKIVSTEPGGLTETINDTTKPWPYGPIEPNQMVSFYCNITKWTRHVLFHPENLTLTVYALTNDTLEEFAFQFTFNLLGAELNITEIIHTEVSPYGTKYLNIIVENPYYSKWNLTISKVTILLPNQTEPLERIFAKNQTVVNIDSSAILFVEFDWQAYMGESITITVDTNEGIEASKTYTITP